MKNLLLAAILAALTVPAQAATNNTQWGAPTVPTEIVSEAPTPHQPLQGCTFLFHSKEGGGAILIRDDGEIWVLPAGTLAPPYCVPLPQKNSGD